LAKCLDQFVVTTQHFSEIGYYPYSAVAGIYGLIWKQDQIVAKNLFSEALRSYKNSPAADWNTHRGFVALIKEAEGKNPAESIQEAVELAIKKIAEQPDEPDQQVHTLMLTRDSDVHMRTQSGEVILQLYQTVASFDDSLSKQVAGKWPFVMTVKSWDEQNIIGGVAMQGSGSLPKSAQLRLDIARAQGQVPDHFTPKEAQTWDVSPVIKISILASRAGSDAQKNPELASHFLDLADSMLGKIEAPYEKLVADAYVVEAAMRCHNLPMATNAMWSGYELGTSLLHDDSALKEIPLKQNSTFLQLKKITTAFGGEREIAVASIDRVADAELRALLFAALAEAPLQNAR